jgi:hypothetical protein
MFLELGFPFLEKDPLLHEGDSNEDLTDEEQVIYNL